MASTSAPVHSTPSKTTMSNRRVRRRRGKRQGVGIDGTPTVPEAQKIPPAIYNDINADLMRLTLVVLNEPEETRQARVTSELVGVLEKGPYHLCGITGILLWHFAQALENGYGGNAQAADEITAVLASAVLAQGIDDD